MKEPSTMATESTPRVVRLRAPLKETEVRDLRAGDEVWLDGIIWGVRDATLIRMFDEGERPEGVNLDGAILMHTAPSVKKDGGKYVPVSVGTTTSMRMNRFTRQCLDLGVRAIIGKGGLGADALPHLRDLGGVYMSITGGAASWETLQIQEIEEVVWEDLMPECLWKFRVKDFGPLFVTMDSEGTSSYAQVQARTQERLSAAYKLLEC
jgi:L(+)-tartrate dehydratase beta subunit